jgi:hypothetical protein
VEKYCSRLVKDTPQHQYVSAFETSDYTAYSSNADIAHEGLEMPGIAQSWIQNSDRRGIFSTLATIGPGDGDADHGVQYQIVAKENLELDVLATADFSTFNPVNGSLG